MTAAARFFGVGMLTLVVGVVAAQGQGSAKQDRKAQEMVRVAAQTAVPMAKAQLQVSTILKASQSIFQVMCMLVRAR